jgi:exodeoxyribonuclease-3
VRVISWNVNGLRACHRKGFLEFLEKSAADVLGLQEVRAFPEQLVPELRQPPGWYTAFAPAERPGYSGVAVYCRQQPDRVDTLLGVERFDVEGRFIVAHFGRLAIASVYFPKGSGKDRDNSRVPYKLEFCAAVFERIEKLRRRGPVLIVGDFNTAHEGWVDVFRRQHADEPGHYTWWRQFGGARENNVGWRIDYVLASPSASRLVQEAFIWPDVTGSDHCPAGVDIAI